MVNLSILFGSFSDSISFAEDTPNSSAPLSTTVSAPGEAHVFGSSERVSNLLSNSVCVACACPLRFGSKSKTCNTCKATIHERCRLTDTCGQTANELLHHLQNYYQDYQGSDGEEDIDQIVNDQEVDGQDIQGTSWKELEDEMEQFLRNEEEKQS